MFVMPAACSDIYFSFPHSVASRLKKVCLQFIHIEAGFRGNCSTMQKMPGLNFTMSHSIKKFTRGKIFPQVSYVQAAVLFLI